MYWKQQNSLLFSLIFHNFEAVVPCVCRMCGCNGLNITGAKGFDRCNEEKGSVPRLSGGLVKNLTPQ